MIKEKDIVKATHDGVLPIGDIKLDVAVLQGGQRIITQNSVFSALGRPPRGNSRVINTPVFMDANNLQPFVGKDLRGVINKVVYESKSGKITEGYDATILPLVCDLYLKAREAGVITRPNQKATAQQAEILVRSLAKVGIISLVDEVTGYQESRDKDALTQFLAKFIKEERGIYHPTYPDEFFEAIFKMRNLTWTLANKGKKPQYFGHFINNFVYSRIAPNVLTELRRVNPKDEITKKRKGKHTQHIDTDYGHPKLKEHLAVLVAFAKATGYNWTNWERMVNRALPKFEIDGSQIQEIEFTEDY